MKLTYNDKLKIYQLRQEGYSTTRLAQEFNVHPSVIKYFVKLIDRHGIEIVKTGKSNHSYSLELKQKMIDEVLVNGNSHADVALKYGLPSKSTLTQWIAQYKKNGYNIVEKIRGKKKTMPKVKATVSDKESLQKELEYLRAENDYLKKYIQISKEEVQKSKEKFKRY